MAAAPSFAEMEYQRIPLDEIKSQHEALQQRLPSADARASWTWCGSGPACVHATTRCRRSIRSATPSTRETLR